VGNDLAPRQDSRAVRRGPVRSRSTTTNDGMVLWVADRIGRSVKLMHRLAIPAVKPRPKPQRSGRGVAEGRRGRIAREGLDGPMTP
jgi:hypothetical protein